VRMKTETRGGLVDDYNAMLRCRVVILKLSVIRFDIGTWKERLGRILPCIARRGHEHHENHRENINCMALKSLNILKTNIDGNITTSRSAS